MRATQVVVRDSDNRASHYAGDLKASRDIIALPAGPLAVSLGLEARRERLDIRTLVDPLIAADIINFGAPSPSLGTASRKVGSAFAETNIPIVRGLEANLAVRADHYGDFGTTVNPKISVR